MDGRVWVNGRISKPEEAVVSVFDRGFLFGDGVYETGRSYGRTPVFLEEHITRLRKSAEKLQITMPWSDEDLRKGLFETAAAFNHSDVYFRTIVTRGPIQRVGLDLLKDVRPTLVHIVQDLTLASIEKAQQQGVRLVTSSVIRNSAQAQDPNIKTSNYLNSLLALQDAKGKGGDDAIMCDAQGHVTEGTTFAVFGVTKAGTLITPSLNVGILDSITRRHVLALAKDEMKAEEGLMPLSKFHECAEAFIASSVREIVPVKEWDDKKFSSVPGKVTARLQELLKGDIQKYVKTGKSF